MAVKYNDFGIKVKIALVKEGMTIPDLAREIGVTAQYIRDICRGNRPGKNTIPLIAKRLGIKAPNEA